MVILIRNDKVRLHCNSLQTKVTYRYGENIQKKAMKSERAKA